MENIEPIGYVISPNKQRYETPHQGVLADDSTSVIRLNPGMNYEQALKHLDGFDMIWVIYRFHLNSTWKPMVTPPRNNDKKVGVFATRSPHRPNNIGLSCVRLLKVEGLDIHISGSDILDGSPVLDIKPYVPYSDSFPSASTGWIKTDKMERYSVEFTETAIEAAGKIKEETGSNLTGYAKVQLAFEPDDTSRKRITEIGNDSYCLSYKEWRINYKIEWADRKVVVTSISQTK